MGEEGCECRPLGFLIGLPFALLALILSLVGAIYIELLVSMLHLLRGIGQFGCESGKASSESSEMVHSTNSLLDSFFVYPFSIRLLHLLGLAMALFYFLDLPILMNWNANSEHESQLLLCLATVEATTVSEEEDTVAQERGSREESVWSKQRKRGIEDGWEGGSYSGSQTEQRICWACKVAKLSWYLVRNEPGGLKG
ncbi:uncharacterized protein HKW66_Vig0219200 [Vigna angularis]|uniref:Uncharacterized protein n=1 Tax=Phaseolus angularis TaxID=3914 RepID=A0A8T0JEW3_PHAAN|nr:uncharacterized protein HKW66_Vig0219200 [Vigna angularis]